MSDGRMHVCLVCHTEPDVWNGGFKSIDTILPVFMERIGEIRDAEENSPRVTWCLTAETAKQRPEPFLALLKQGHEIGVHSHYPGGDGMLEHKQEINCDNLDRFGEWLPELCGIIKSAGFPPPRTSR